MANWFTCTATQMEKRMSRRGRQSIEQKKKVVSELQKIARDWDSGVYKNIKDAGYNTSEDFLNKWSERNGPLDFERMVPTIYEIRKFKSDIKRWDKQLGRKENPLTAFVRLPRRLFERTPETEMFSQEMVMETQYFRRQTTQGRKRVNSILKEFKKLAVDLGGDPAYYSRLERNIDLEKSKNNSKKLAKLLEEKRNYLNSSAGQSYLALTQALEGVSMDQIQILKGNPMARKRMENIVNQWGSLRREVSISLIRGLEKLQSMSKDNPKHKELVDKVRGMIKRIEFQQVVDRDGKPIDIDSYTVLNDDLAKLGFKTDGDDGYVDSKGRVAYAKYVPHYVLGLPKVMRRIDRIINNDPNVGQDGRVEDLNVLRDNVIKSLDEMGAIVDRAKHRTSEQNDYSRDPFYFMKKYVGDVAIFNYRTHIKDTFKRTYEGLNSRHLNATTNKNNHTAEALHYLMKKTHDVYTTLSDIDPDSKTTGTHLMRAITAYTYFRLLGGNFRSGARNATQRINELHEWGVEGWREADAFYSDIGGAESNKTDVQKLLEKYGLLWFSGKTIRGSLLDSLKGGSQGLSEASQGALSDSFIADYGLKVDQNGEIVRSSQTVSETISKGVSGIAEKAAFAHKVVEDWNRTNTFKIAYALSKSRLSEMPDTWKMMKSGKKNKEDIAKWEVNEAGKMAYNSVLDIHYEYAKWAKAKALSAAPGGIRVGEFLGQFMHYRFSLFDMHYKWIREAGVSLAAGDFTSSEMWRLGRWGMTSAMIGGVLSPLLNINFGSLFNNDDLETVDKAYTYMTTDRNDPEAMELLDKKLYGQGLQHFLGPNVNLMASIKELYDFYMIGESGDKATPHEALADNSFLEDNEVRKRFKLMSLLNAQLARTWNYTAPLFYRSGIIDAGRLELGIFPNKEMRDIRRDAQNFLGEHVHENLAAHTKKKRKKTYTPEEREAIIRSMSALS